MSVWRGTKDTLVEVARIFMSRVGANITVFKFIGDLERDGTLSRDAWLDGINTPLPPSMPVRSQLIRTQIYAETALAFDQTDLGLLAIDRLDQLGFMDVTWLDGCPLLEKIVADRQFTQLRQSIGARARSVLAAFHSVTAHS